MLFSAVLVFITGAVNSAKVKLHTLRPLREQRLKSAVSPFSHSQAAGGLPCSHALRAQPGLWAEPVPGSWCSSALSFLRFSPHSADALVAPASVLRFFTLVRLWVAVSFSHPPS